MNQSFGDYLRKLLSHKAFCIAILFTTVLCFGFTITNHSIGVDDPCASHYLYSNEWGSMIQQGRLIHLLYNSITHSLDFLPFFNDFLGASLYALSAILLSAFFSYITQNKLSVHCLSIFSCVYISCPIIAEKFIYNLDVIVTMMSYCAVALSLVYAYNASQSKWNILKAIVCLIVGISSYETFGFVYISAVLSIFILRIVVNNEELNIKQIFFEGIKYALILLVSYTLYYSLVILVQILSGQYGLFVREYPWQSSSDSIIEIVINTTKTLIWAMFFNEYLPMIICSICVILGFVLFAILSFRKHNVLLFLCYCGMFACNLFIHFIFGFFMYRASQTICFFVAFVVLMLVYTLSHKVLYKKIIALASVLLILVQAAELNRWFYNDHIRFQKESFVVHTIATEILMNCDISKPIIFTRMYDEAYLSSDYIQGGQTNGNSVLWWGVDAFQDITSYVNFELFKMYGYDFLVRPTEQQALEALTYIESIENWPTDGYLTETEKYIIVKIP